MARRLIEAEERVLLVDAIADINPGLDKKIQVGMGFSRMG